MDGVTIGPDLNPTRSDYDKKLYKLILLPNGLRCLLISDTLALKHLEYEEEDDDESSISTSSEEEEEDQEGHSESDNYDGGNTDNGGGGGYRKAAAAMVVGAGSYYDPEDCQGLAHFLEHMLFMGNDKYPTENAFSSFLSSHGGYDNAYTECEYTLYHFEVSQKKFFEALDMFAQFFISPLMLPDAVDRELKAIDSEFHLSEKSDSCRLQELLCYTSKIGDDNSRHPFGNFSWGNTHSLKTIPEEKGVDVMKELRTFYDQYYYGANERLVVMGGFTLEELEKQVLECFQHIPASPRQKQRVDFELQHCSSLWDATVKSPLEKFGSPFRNDGLGTFYRVVPVADRHSLSITWPIPSQFDYWKSDPSGYLAHLIGHESSGSILSSLKDKGWARGIHAGVSDCGYQFASSHALYNVTVMLTEAGVSAWSDVVDYIYSYLGMLRYHMSTVNGLPGWIFDEVKDIKDLTYKFADEQDPMETVEYYCEMMAPCSNVPPENILNCTSLLFESQLGIVKQLVDDFLTPQNARIDLISSYHGRDSDFTLDKENGLSGLKFETGSSVCSAFSRENIGSPNVDPVFGTKFWCWYLENSQLEKWSSLREPRLPNNTSLFSCLSLPPRNRFIPSDLKLRELPHDDADHPLLFCSLKICITVKKKKMWIPGIPKKYNSLNNKLLVSYEDEEEKWHSVDMEYAHFESIEIKDFEGTFEKNKLKYRVIALPNDGPKFGDESDYDDFVSFPAIPPALPLSRLPKLVTDTKVLKLWHLHDRVFKRPIGEIRLNIICQDANKSPLARAVLDLFSAICSDALTELTYMASMCELHTKGSITDTGFTLRVEGFNDRVIELLSEILTFMLSFRTLDPTDNRKLPNNINPETFDVCLESLRRGYNNDNIKASTQSANVRLRCLRVGLWSAFAKQNSISNLTVSEFLENVSLVMESIKVEALLHGNFDSSDAERASVTILDIIKASGNAEGFAAKKHPFQLVLQCPKEKENPIITVPSKDPGEPNTSVEVYFQIGRDDIRKRVITDLLEQMMDDPLYNQLRTQEQFGYSVSCGARWTYGVLGMSFIVVSSSKDADTITERLDRFLFDFEQELCNMKEDKFLEELVGLAETKLEIHNSLQEECASHWNMILERRYDWEAHRAEAITLKTITKDMVLQHFQEWFAPSIKSNGKTNKRRRFVVQVIGNSDKRNALMYESVDTISRCIDMEEKVEKYHDNVGRSNHWGKIM